jgi:hypothetical protein
MSKEITVNLKVDVKNGFLAQSFSPGTVLVDMSGTTATGGVQDIGTSTNAEALSMSDVSSAGWAWFRNCDTTNYVDIGSGTGTNFAPVIRLKAGEVAALRLATNAPTARANTAAVKLLYNILAD